MKITRKRASNSPVTFVINKHFAAHFFLHFFSIFHPTNIFFFDVAFHSRSVPCCIAGAECSKCSKVLRHDNSSWNVPMVTVSFESFSSHLLLCYCLYHIAFFNENIDAIVTWSCFKNRITNFTQTFLDVWNKIFDLSFNRLSSRRMASEKSEFERVVIANRNYRKTIDEKSTIAM